MSAWSGRHSGREAPGQAITPAVGKNSKMTTWGPNRGRTPRDGEERVTNMKQLKKALAVVLALTVMLAMSAVTFAADGQYDATVTVNGIKAGNTLKLYKIADAAVGADNAIAYTMASGLPADYNSIEEIEAVKGDAVKAMAEVFGATFGGKEATYSFVAGEGDKATGTVAPGYYYAIVSGNKDTGIIYKSMLINAVPEVDGNGYKANTKNTNLNVKSEPEKVTKTEPDPTTAAAAAHSTDGYTIGQDIPFTITTTIPNYPSNSINATFVIKDAPVGLQDKVDTVKVYVGEVGSEAEVAADESKYTVNAAGKGFTVKFKKEYILANPGKSVKVTYDGTLTGPVTLSGGTENTASIEYNPNPYEETTVKPDDTDKQKTYGLVFEKVDESNKALENAVFALYNADGTKAITDASGNALTFTTEKQTIDGADHTYVWFEGLAAGTYTIKETSAPAGYVKVQDFTMTVGASSTSDNPATVDKEEKNYTVKDSAVENEKGSELPSTGGIGTTIFYIVGAILVVGAGILLISRRRMQAK